MARPRKQRPGIFIWRNTGDATTVYTSTRAPEKVTRGVHNADWREDNGSEAIISQEECQALLGFVPRVGGNPTYMVDGVVTEAPAIARDTAGV